MSLLRSASTVFALAVVFELVGGVVCAMGCQTTNVTDTFTWVDDLEDKQLEAQPYRIRSNDRVQIVVFKQESFSGEALVRADGNVTVPLVGDIVVVGLTPPQASEEIAKRLAATGFIDKPVVSVAVLETRVPAIVVVGEVRAPGAFELRPGMTVLDVVAQAGGLSEFANKQRVFVIRKSEENLRVRFNYDKLTHSDGNGMKFKLQDGDVIVVE